jgi:ABC-type multidrug transport system ATPase subunit
VQFSYDNDNIISTLYEKNSHKFDDIVSVLKDNDIQILDISTEDSDLEDVFVQLTNN